MTPTLTDEELAELERVIADRGDCAGPMTSFEGSAAYVAIRCRDNWPDVIRWMAHAVADMPRLIAELRHHRSRELSAEDVEALRWLAFMLGKHGHEPYAYESEKCDRAIAVLERLCAAKEGV